MQKMTQGSIVRHLLGYAILQLSNILHWNTDLKNLIFKVSVFNCLLNVGFYFVLIARICVDYIPICF